MESELRVFVEEDGYFTVRELLTDEDGLKMVGLNPLTPLGRSLDELKGELMDYMEALNKPHIKEGQHDYFVLEYEETPPIEERH